MASTNADANLDRLSERLGHRFADPQLLRQALTHSSAAGSRKAELVSYERLEFLGDRVVGLIVADMLLERFPDEPEGALARRHAFLVSREALAEVARDLGLGEFLHISKGEDEGGGRQNPTMLADVCEAIIGALYRDSGLDAARTFVVPKWDPLVRQDRKPPQDSKTALQEWAQGRGLPLPTYRVVQRSGPPHDPQFTVEAMVDGFDGERGQGRSKRLAEQDAATRLLQRLQTAEGTNQR
ncbi:ribonuclease III [Rhodovibrio salinarum]|uniref:Ribonuclease 3 n=1 Tax=Rhodovibrio salinarum TaxID=1087 RepID=A0A934QJF6_9PROT|nr:ribonuclease III [Rhodovibrio salinarum]MBK1698004.1 ribonuclease III [Rhodovibrio salinarum]